MSTDIPNDLQGWELNPKGEIAKTIKSTGFRESLLLVNAIGLLAEKADHHPDILIQWNKVQLSLITHSEKKLTEKDFSLARKIDQLPIL